MIAILSPAKTLDYSTLDKKLAVSTPAYLDKSEQLITKLRTISKKRLGEMMSISKDLAELNHQRYQDWDPNFNTKNSKPAILTFKGDVYRGLDAESFSEELQFAQDHIRILSGLYGLLKPMDLLKAYRLEMGTRLPVRRKKNLYEFWGDELTNQINMELESHSDKTLINLASNEYAKAVNFKKLKNPYIDIVFKDMKNGVYKNIMTFSKLARGYMTQFIVKNGISKIDQLKEFTTEGYKFRPKLSSDTEYVFTRG